MGEATPRWTAFLARVRGRYAALVEETEVGCAALLADCDDDPGAMTNAFTAMRSRLITLEQRVEATWSDQLEPMLDDEDDEDALQASGWDLVSWMEREREALRSRVSAHANARLEARGEAERPPSLACLQCGGRNATPTGFVAVHVQCRYCDAQMTWEPGARLRAAGHRRS